MTLVSVLLKSPSAEQRRRIPDALPGSEYRKEQMTAVPPKKRTSDEETEYTRESKSARKREAKRYEQLGRDLVMLGDQDFEKLDFGDNDELRSEMLTGRRLRGQYESFRRQMMHVGRLLMTCDISELEKELRIIQGRRTSGSAELHRIEKIREDLIGPDGSAALNDIMGKCPSLDRSKIRALIKKAHAEEEQGRPPAASRELFRYIRDNYREAGAEEKSSVFTAADEDAEEESASTEE